MLSLLFHNNTLTKTVCYSLSTLIKTTFRSYCNSSVTTKINKKVGFIGDGNMAKAICKAIETKGLISYSQVYVSSPYPKYLADWQRRGANVFTDNAEVATKADIIFLAVKPVVFPQVMDALLKSEKVPLIKNKLFVSILAGIKIKNLEEASVALHCFTFILVNNRNFRQ